MKNSPKIVRKDGFILKVGLNSTHVEKVLAFIRDSITRRHKFIIVTPNPEIIVKAQKDIDLLNFLNRADISLPDGTGLTYAWRFLRLPGNLTLIKGREMLVEMLKVANKRQWRVFFLGGKEGTAKKAAEILKRSLKKVKIGFAAGPDLNLEGEPLNRRNKIIEENTKKAINRFKPELLFVGFGAPKQEKWLARNLHELNVGGAMVVGGAFDYLAGNVRMPPKWMAERGLEWLWRLLIQPSRIKRIINAVVVFPFLVFLSKMGLDTPEPL